METKLISCSAALDILGVPFSKIDGFGMFLYDENLVKDLAARMRDSFAEDERVEEMKLKTLSREYFAKHKYE